MKLTIVSPYPPNITGIGQYGYYVSRLLAQSGFFTHIRVLTGRSKIQSNLASHPIIDVQSAWDAESPACGWQIAAELQRSQPDLVWFNFGASIFGRSPLANLSGFLTPFLGRSMGIPVVVTLHELVELADLRALQSPGGLLAPFGARLLTQIALQGDVVCLTMQRYVDWLARNYGHKQSMHIPVGAYHVPELLSSPENQAGEILFFTTLAPYKGLEVLLEAFQTLQREIPDLRLTIAGAEHPRFPGYSAEIRRKTAAMSGIRWLGQVPESQVRDLYQQSQIVCIPYTASTGSSSVLYQAAMWGRAVVASDLAETRSVARESNLEVAFFRSGSSASLAGSLKTLLDSAEMRSNQVARNFSAIQRIRPEDVCQAYLRAFNQALEMHSSPNRLPIPAQLDQRPA